MNDNINMGSVLAVSVKFIQLVNDLYQVSSFTSSVSDVYTVSQWFYQVSSFTSSVSDVYTVSQWFVPSQ
jgi:hypothetical protein